MLKKNKKNILLISWIWYIDPFFTDYIQFYFIHFLKP